MTNSEPPPFTPTRVNVPRFQMRISDFFVLFGFLAFHLMLWGNVQRPRFMILILVTNSVGWLFILFIAQHRLEKSDRSLRLALYMAALAVPLSIWFMISNFYYKVQLRDELYHKISAPFYISDQVEKAASKYQRTQPTFQLSSLSQLKPYLPKTLVDAECPDPFARTATYTPCNGYLIKTVTVPAHNATVLPFAYLIYPAEYSRDFPFTYLVIGDELFKKDLGDDTLSIVSKLEKLNVEDWKKLE